MGANFLHAVNEKSDQNARMRRLIGVFIGPEGTFSDVAVQIICESCCFVWILALPGIWARRMYYVHAFAHLCFRGSSLYTWSRCLSRSASLSILFILNPGYIEYGICVLKV